MIREAVTASPLYWPPGWTRHNGHRRRSNFRTTSVHFETQQVLGELGRMRVPSWNVIVSTNLELRNDGMPRSNQRTPNDAGAAVWFTLDREERVLACDRWDRVEHNLRAIALHVAAIRGQDRWGVGSLEQAFRGFTALPAGALARSWWDVLECRPDAEPDLIRRQYKVRALVSYSGKWLCGWRQWQMTEYQKRRYRRRSETASYQRKEGFQSRLIQLMHILRWLRTSDDAALGSHTWSLRKPFAKRSLESMKDAKTPRFQGRERATCHRIRTNCESQNQQLLFLPKDSQGLFDRDGLQ